MTSKEIGATLTSRNVEEFAWRHFWLTNVMIDAGRPIPEKLARPRVTRRMSPARRLHKLHRMRAMLGSS